MMTSQQVELMLRKPEKEKRVKSEKEKVEKFSHRAQIDRMKKQRNLPELNVTDVNTYVPNLTYFHCITKKKGIQSTQVLRIRFNSSNLSSILFYSILLIRSLDSYLC